MNIKDSFTTQIRRLLFTRADNSKVYLSFHWYEGESSELLTCNAFIQLVWNDKATGATKDKIFVIPFTVALISGGNTSVWVRTYIFKDGCGTHSNMEEKCIDTVNNPETSIHLLQAQAVERAGKLIMAEYYDKAMAYYNNHFPVVLK